MTSYEERRERRRRFMRRNMAWLIPLGAVVGAGLFVGLGFLVTWLWRVTLGDIFGLKPISFWQAWGLMVLCQILFKANVQPTTRTGSMRHRGSEPAAVPMAPTGGPEQAM